MVDTNNGNKNHGVVGNSRNSSSSSSRNNNSDTVDGDESTTSTSSSSSSSSLPYINHLPPFHAMLGSTGDMMAVCDGGGGCVDNDDVGKDREYDSITSILNILDKVMEILDQDEFPPR